MVKKYLLEGSHMIAGEELIKEIKRVIFYNEEVAIPRYVIINRKGEIVEKDAKRPSSGQQLIEQLKEKLQLSQ